MTNFLTKYFKLPEQFRNVSIDHTSYIAGKGLLQYPEENPRFFSHVHEKGMYFIAKIRDDNLKRTQHYRQLIKDGIYKMFSINGEAVPDETVVEGNRAIRKIYDIDPFEVAIVKEGMNVKAGPIELLKQDEKPPADWWDACISHVTGADPAAVCGHIFHHVLGGDRSRADPSMFEKGIVFSQRVEKKRDLSWHEEAEAILRKHFPKR